MIRDLDPTVQALLGTLFTWGVTALGAAVVFVAVIERKGLDASLGFAAGVMIAASYWSLLAPGIEMAETSGSYGANGEYAFIPVSLGFFLGALFVYGAEVLLDTMGIGDKGVVDMLTTKKAAVTAADDSSTSSAPGDVGITRASLRKRTPAGSVAATPQRPAAADTDDDAKRRRNESWRRTMLLVIAVTVHNIPEGLAVGVGFGAIGSTASATFESARNLAIGIGIQNFPEGLAVSLPLYRAGYSMASAFWYGQLSGMVEPIAGLLGAVAVSWAEPLLPYALSFAAGAMIYVVLDDIVPETTQSGNGRIATWGAIVGFIVMMSLDVGLG